MLWFRRDATTLNLDDPDARPYFLWNEPTTIRRLREILAEPSDPARPVYMARIMREARYDDVWQFLSLSDVVENWERIQVHLGRQRAFWEYLLSVWKRHGII